MTLAEKPKRQRNKYRAPYKKRDTNIPIISRSNTKVIYDAVNYGVIIIDFAWNDIQDQLPKHGQKVIVQVNGWVGETTATFIDSESFWKRLSHEARKGWINLAHYCHLNGQYRFVGKYNIPIDGVTHWKPANVQ